MSDPKIDAELYKTLLVLHDAEVSRFYGRQQIYFGYMAVVVAGLLAGADHLDAYPGLVRLGLFTTSVIALLNALTATRSLAFNRIVFGILGEYEKRNEGSLDVLRLARSQARGGSLRWAIVVAVAASWVIFVVWVVVAFAPRVVLIP